MSLKNGLNLTSYYSINFDLPKRRKKLIKFVIIHYTGMKKESKALEKLADPKSKVSSHYFIKNNGNIINLVPDLYTAWHAGKSSWKKFKTLNKYSIGIEINNPGHFHGYKKFSFRQINSLFKLLKYLMRRYNIKRQNILGHSDISPDRKKDPGEKFPWNKLAKKNLCLWHDLKEEQIKKYRNLKLKDYDKKIFFKNLYKIGYSKISGANFKNNRKNLVRAFQRKYRQNLLNGKIDQECLIISKNLIKS